MIAELELAIVTPDEIAGVLAVAPGMPAGLTSWWDPRQNVAPTQPVRTIAIRGDRPKLTLARWGLTTFSRAGKRPPLINVRAETAATNGMFKGPIARGRCLVVADGFYEWRGEGKAKVPVKFAPAGAADDGRAITLAAIGRDRDEGGVRVHELAIVTADADDLVRPIHDRRPVVIAAADRERWLDASVPVDGIADLLTPASLAGWAMTDMPAWINSARVERPPDQPSLF